MRFGNVVVYGERDENGFLVSGYWEDPEFENIGFIRVKFSQFFPMSLTR